MERTGNLAPGEAGNGGHIMAVARSTRTLRTILIALAMTAFGSPAYGKVIYVDDDAWGLDNGTSWSNAYVYLQDALAEAVGAAKPVEIWVAQGVCRTRERARSSAIRPRRTSFSTR
jgi:hypothetical protein